MSNSDWWQDNRTEAVPSFRWFGSRNAETESPLRIAIIPGNPASVESSGVDSSDAEPVSWLLSHPLPSAETTNVVSLEPIPQRASTSETVSRERDDDPVSRRFKRQDSRADKGPTHERTLAKRLRVLLEVPLELLLPGPATVLEWPGSLMPFQREGVRELIKREKLLLADDMGLGKTVQVIAAIRILVMQRRMESTLVIAPASLLDQWRRELSKWAPELKAIIIRGTPVNRAWQWRAKVHVALVSYETLMSDFAGNLQSPPRKKIWDLVVIDEAQRIKNRNDTSNTVKQIQRRRSWALTGTPLENQIDDLASIMEFVDHGELVSSIHYQPGEKLLERHKELQLRRKKVDVLDQLPPKRVSKISLSLLPRQQESYERAERDGIVHLRELGATVRIQHVLELITRLKQICNADPETGESVKLNDIRDRLTILRREGNRAIIFSQYTSETFGVGAVANAIEDFRPLTFTGGMSSQHRDDVIRRFKSDDSHTALILSLRAGGLGLNLQEASYVFHLDRWWNPAVERQAEDRSHRYGQVFPVNVVKYMCLGTIEERIDTILERKQRLFDEFIDDVSVDVSARLNSEEIFGLFGIDAPSQLQSVPASGPTGIGLEELCARILENHGWSVRRTPLSRIDGVDVVATKSDEIGIEETLYVYCNDHARPVGVSTVRELIGVIPAEGNVRPILASPSGVTSDALHLANQRGIILWDGKKLNELENLS